MIGRKKNKTEEAKEADNANEELNNINSEMIDIKVKSPDITNDGGKNTPITHNSPIKSAFAIFSQRCQIEEPSLNLHDPMEIPNEFNAPLSIPYVSSMSPHSKRKEVLIPSKKFSTKLFDYSNLLKHN